MKSEEFKKLRESSITELRSFIEKTRRELMDLRLNLTLGKVKDVKELKRKRIVIAKMMTLVREKEFKEQL